METTEIYSHFFDKKFSGYNILPFYKRSHLRVDFTKYSLHNCINKDVTNVFSLFLSSGISLDSAKFWELSKSKTKRLESRKLTDLWIFRTMGSFVKLWMSPNISFRVDWHISREKLAKTRKSEENWHSPYLTKNYQQKMNFDEFTIAKIAILTILENLNF